MPIAKKIHAHIWLWPVLLAAQAAQAEAPRQNVVNFSYTATRELTQDQLQITLQVIKEGSVPADVQAQIKQVLDGALAEAKRYSQPGAVEIRTGAFSLGPRYGNNGRIQGWQGQAQLVLEGSDLAHISQLAGRLNQLNVVNTSFGMSRALRASQEASLTTEAIAGFRARADGVAHDFGMKGYVLGEVNVSSSDSGWVPRPVPMLMRAKVAEMAADAPLPVEPGKAQLSVTVSGQIQLQP